jgi:hypothetical protein
MTGYSRSPNFIKGALIQFTEEFLGPIPNIILFQYNPETMTRSLEPYSDPETEGEPDDTVEAFDPSETFDVQLVLDATDALEHPDKHPVAVVSGVADRVSALEMLLYPSGDGSVLGDLVGSVFGGGADPVPRRTVPVTLFVWGPGRIVPVKLKSFSVDEQAYSTLLYPVRATVSVGLQVLTPEAFERPGGTRTLAEEIAVAAYKYTKGQKELLAIANMANSVESILGMLPF